MKFKLIVAVIAMCFSALPALAVVKMGYVPGHPFLETEETVAGFNSYLGKNTALKIESMRCENEQKLVAHLKAGDIDFAILSNLLSGDFSKSLHLAATAIVNGSMSTQLFLLVPAHENINFTADLKEKTAAVVIDDPNQQLKAYFINKAVGCQLADHFKWVRQYSEISSAIQAVANRQATATCVSDSTLATLKEYDPSLMRGLQVLKQSPLYPNNPVVFGSKTPVAVRQKLVAALFGMQKDDLAQNLLMEMHIDGFGVPEAGLSIYPHLPGHPPKRISPQSVIPGNQKLLEQPKKQRTVRSATPSARRVVKAKAKSALPSIPTAALKRKRIDPLAVSAVVVPPVVKKNLRQEADVSDSEPSQVLIDDQQQPDSDVVTTEVDMFANVLSFYQNNYLYIVLVSAVALLLLAWTLIQKFYRNRQVVVLMRRRREIVAIRVIKGRKGVMILRGETQPVDDNTSVLNLLQRVGHHSQIKVIVVCDSDTSAVYGFSLPLLDENKIAEALYWKLKEKKIPVPEDRHELAFLVRNRNRKTKTMDVDLQINLDKEVNCPCHNLAIKPERVLSIELCLLSLLRQHPEYSGDAGIAMLYLQSAGKAIFILPGNTTGLLSRHIYSFVDRNGKSTLASFQNELHHTLNYFREKNGLSFHSLLIAGPGLNQLDQSLPRSGPLDLEEGQLEDLEGMELSRVNLATVVQVRGLEKVEDIPEVELLVGAATTAHFS